MTKWVDQKNVEMRIIASDAWQAVLDELEKPTGQFTPRHASTILKEIAEEYSRMEDEAAALLGGSSPLSSESQNIMEIVCQKAVEAIR